MCRLDPPQATPLPNVGIVVWDRTVPPDTRLAGVHPVSKTEFTCERKRHRGDKAERFSVLHRPAPIMLRTVLAAVKNKPSGWPLKSGHS
jgi:hypothetical protein